MIVNLPTEWRKAYPRYYEIKEWLEQCNITYTYLGYDWINSRLKFDIKGRANVTITKLRWL